MRNTAHTYRPRMRKRKGYEKRASEEASTDMTYPNATPKIQKALTMIHNKRLTLLSHIIRSDANDPLRQVTFEKHNLKPLTPAFKRVGRPRSKWIETTTKEAWQIMSDVGFIKSEAQHTQIKMQAISRTIPF